MTYVFDATPLIYLAKVERLGILKRLSVDCLVPGMVHHEVVVNGSNQGYPDARRVERAVENGIFDVRQAEKTNLNARLDANPNLSSADAAVLSLTEHVSGTAVMDERYGRSVADTESIPARGTAYLLLSLVKSDFLTADEARSAIDDMLDAGWYCAPNLYAKIVRKLDALSDA